MIDELYAELSGELQRYLTAWTRDRAAAEDICQETFLRALDREAQLDALTPDQRRAWLYRTAKRLAMDRARRLRELGLPEGDRGYVQDLTRPEVEALLGLLTPRDREMFYLRYYAGYNATELGAMYGLSPANVRMRLKAARAILKKEWKP